MSVGAITVIVIDGLTAGVPMPFEAATVNVNVPAVVGMPLSTPAELSGSPVGSVPLAGVSAVDADGPARCLPNGPDF